MITVVTRRVNKLIRGRKVKLVKSCPFYLICVQPFFPSKCSAQKTGTSILLAQPLAVVFCSYTLVPCACLLLFSLATVKLPLCVQHALYADDITIWATQGAHGDIQANLQQVGSIVDHYARQCGLQCSPSKFVHIRPSPKCTAKTELPLETGLIPEQN